MNTVPTGFCSLPPSGPAMPVMAMPTCVFARSRAPFAICSAIGALTAPCTDRSLSETPSSSNLAALE